MNLFKRDKSFEVDGWLYEYTKTGIQITNPQGQKVGRPIPLPDVPIGKNRSGWSWFINGLGANMQQDMPNGSNNPFTQAHKATAHKAEKAAAAQEIAARDARITAASHNRNKPKVKTSYTPAGPFWGPK